MPKFNTLTDIFDHALKHHPEGTTFYSKDKNKNYRGVSFRELYCRGENAGIALAEMGLKPGDNIGVMADNRLEWIISDIAVQLNGAVNVPRGSDSTEDEIQYILEHCEAEICFIEHANLLKKVEPILPKTKVKTIIILDPEFNSGDSGIKTLQNLIDEGEALRDSKLADLKERKKNIKPEDLFTIIYTSGTTGVPKGAMLTHRNIAYNIEVMPMMVGVNVGDRVLSILPIWHIFERALEYAMIPYGAKLYYSNVRDLRDDFLKARPTFMGSAPRLWETLYNGIMQRMQKEESAKKFLFDAAVGVNRKFQKDVTYLQGNDLKTERESDLDTITTTAISALRSVNLLLPAKVLDALVFARIREALGGSLRGTISGGGALPAHVDEFFNIIGIPVYEGYGMTECAPIISARTVGHIVQGSVGFIPEGTRVRILNDNGEEVPVGEKGVIHVKGPQVMRGYYKNEEATKKVLNDGWLNTGDIGFFSYNGTLSIRGRAKDTIVLLGGENLEPVPIENLLQRNQFINQIMVVGQDKKTLGALIWPEHDELKEQGFKVLDSEDLNQNSTLRKHYSDIIKKTISAENGFKPFERVTSFRFIPKPFEVGDELTNLFKMKRNVITDKYQDMIDKMYT